MALYAKNVYNLTFLGGYWGIFLGYTLINLPQLFGKWLKKVELQFGNGKVGKITWGRK